MTSDFLFLANNWFQYLPTYVAFILNLHILNIEFKWSQNEIADTEFQSEVNHNKCSYATLHA